MANEQLINYIKTVQAQGFPEANIREVLAKNGWQANDVEEAFSYMKLSSQAPVGASYVAPASQAWPTVTTISKPTMVSDHSPYAIGLAAVLFVALMVLVNSIIDDSASFFGESINSKFIFDTFIILPFLGIAFLLKYLFKDTEHRFSAISQPYFILSGVLLIRLLWNVCKYLLDTNAVYGVYIVLVLIILVLTSVILFVQNYIKK